MDSYQSYFRKLDILFPGKQRGAIRTNRKICYHLLYHFCMVVTIFKVATSLSIFSTTRHFLAQQRKQMKGSSGPATPTRGSGLPPTPPTPPSLLLFCIAKRKKASKGKNERIPKQKLLKSCNQGQNVTVLAILGRLELKKFSC